MSRTIVILIPGTTASTLLGSLGAEVWPGVTVADLEIGAEKREMCASCAMRSSGGTPAFRPR